MIDMFSWVKELLRCKKLDVVPSDATHYELDFSGEHKVYWKEECNKAFLWHGIYHHWQEMNYADFEKYKSKLTAIN